MALDRLLDLFNHQFLCLVLFLYVLVIPTCGRLSWVHEKIAIDLCRQKSRIFHRNHAMYHHREIWQVGGDV